MQKLLLVTLLCLGLGQLYAATSKHHAQADALEQEVVALEAERDNLNSRIAKLKHKHAVEKSAAHNADAAAKRA